MAYTPYTPVVTAAHTTIQIPDDAELESAGIAAVNTPLEEIADNAGTALIQLAGSGIVAPARFTLGPFSVIDTTTTTIVQDTTPVDCMIGFGIRVQYDYITCVASFTCQTGACGTTLHLAMRSDGGMWTFRQSLTILDGQYTAVTLTGSMIVSTAGLQEAAIAVENAASTGTTVIRGELSFTGHMSRGL